MKLELLEFELPLKHTFTISRESYSSQPTLIVALGEEGHVGYGEATTNAYYGVSSATLRLDMESVRAELEARSLGLIDPPQLWHQLHEKLAHAPFALCAIDQAAHDLWGKLRRQPVYKLWGLTLDHIPASCFTIGIDTIEVMIDKLNEMAGWPIYKIKLGTDQDVEIVRALRRHTDAVLRVDANGGWSLDEAIRNAAELAQLNVEFIEQPLPADHWSDQQVLFEQSHIPILADESCLVEADITRCAGHFHGVNIKLPKCGGLTPARRMIEAARRYDLQVMVGCMTESTVGISAIAQLLPLLDYVDMDGAALLAEDIAAGVRLERGICHFPDVNGHGVELFG